MKYMVNSQDKPHNYPLYSVHSDLDSFILYKDGEMECQIAQLEDDVYNMEERKATPEEDKTVKIKNDEPIEPMWSLYFDGVVSKEGSRAGVWVFNSKARYL
jgi:hypothetical protein